MRWLLESWKLWFEIFGLLAVGATVVFGAAALILCHRIDSQKNTQLRQFDADLTAAKTELGKQQERAAKAEKDVAGLKVDVANADAKAEGFRLDIAKANERAAEANRIAEEEKLARVKIEERLASRRIGQNQHAELVAALRPYRGAVVEVTKLGDFEAGQFADDILSVLSEAGWNVRLTTIGIYAPPPYGLACVINDTTPAGKALVAAMRSLPTAAVEAAPDLPINARILVGLKPPT